MPDTKKPSSTSQEISRLLAVVRRDTLVTLRKELAENQKAAEACARRCIREQDECARLSREAEAFRLSAATSAASQEVHEATIRRLQATIELLTGEPE